MEKAGTAAAAAVLLQAAVKIGGDAGIEMAIGRLDDIDEPFSLVRQSPAPRN